MSLPKLDFSRRINFPEYACLLAWVASCRSEDINTKVGACVLNQEGRVLSLGYNGVKTGYELSEDIMNSRDEKLKYFIHAEMNSLSLIKRGDAYLIGSTHSPCLDCAKNIISHGIKFVYYLEEYHREQTFKEIFKEYNVCYSKIELPFIH